MSRQKTLAVILSLIVAGLTGLPGIAAARSKSQPVPLTGQGEKLEAKYENLLSALRKEVASALPSIDEAKKGAFLDALAALNSIATPAEGAAGSVMAKYKEAKSLAESNTMHQARAVLADLDSFLSTDTLDGKLTKIAILTHGTPRRLAEFASQGKETNPRGGPRQRRPVR
jgi:hypothetical protein